MSQLDPKYRFSSDSYQQKINSPSTSPEYFDQFVAPHVALAIQKAQEEKSPAILVDLACGHAHGVKRIETIPGHENLQVFGIDLSAETLAEAQASFAEHHPSIKITFVEADAENELVSPPPETADVGVAINAMAYKQAHMLKTMLNALKPGGKCVINFFTPGKNDTYIKNYETKGTTLKIRTLQVDVQEKSETFDLLVTDLSTYEDPELQKLGEQAFFQSTEDIERLIALIGFNVSRRDEFEFHSAAIDNTVHNYVYTLEKPTETEEVDERILSVREKILQTVPLREKN